MVKITEIYNLYKIPPNLQLHQLRVAAVASIICDNFKAKLDSSAVITACLLHDMGNIVKFDFEAFPEFTKPEGKDYWKNIQDEVIRKYGSDEHEATTAIISEIGAEEVIIKLVNSVGFVKAESNCLSKNYAIKICSYSDMRVAPNFVTSLKARLMEAKERYVYQRKKWNEEEFEFYESRWEKIEEQIFEKCSIAPYDITDEKVYPLIEDLKNFEFNLSG